MSSARDVLDGAEVPTPRSSPREERRKDTPGASDRTDPAWRVALSAQPAREPMTENEKRAFDTFWSKGGRT
jgi:hypothetical protein